jgi:hypothetical protein
MFLFLVAGAAVVDALAAGIWIGAKYNTTVTTIETDVTGEVSAIETSLAALKAKVTPTTKTPVAKPAAKAPVAAPAPVAPVAVSPLAASVVAQAATAPA